MVLTILFIPLLERKFLKREESMDDKEWRNSTRNKSALHKLEERAQR